ncbi:MAG: hypothetical protein AAF710_00700 [Planctomycetota bacterium]
MAESDETYELDTVAADAADAAEAKRAAALRRLRANAEERRTTVAAAVAEAETKEGLEPEAPRRFCLGCDFELTDFEEPGRCPKCDRGFDPQDDSTTRDSPLPVRELPYLLQTPRMAGYAWLVLFLIGRSAIATLGGDWVTGISGGSGVSQADAAVGAAVAVLTGLLLIPWLLGCALLGLIAIGEHHNPGNLAVTVLLGIGLASLMVLGLNPGLLLAAGILGAFAGLLRTWRAT